MKIDYPGIIDKRPFGPDEFGGTDYHEFGDFGNFEYLEAINLLKKDNSRKYISLTLENDLTYCITQSRWTEFITAVYTLLTQAVGLQHIYFYGVQESYHLVYPHTSYTWNFSVANYELPALKKRFKEICNRYGQKNVMWLEGHLEKVV